MQCPNCKTELVQVNGRYICSDCGKEVPEAEINQGDWGQGSFDGSRVVPAPEPGAVDSHPEDIDQSIGETAELVIPTNGGLDSSDETIEQASDNATQTPMNEKSDTSGFYASDDFGTTAESSSDEAVKVAPESDKPSPSLQPELEDGTNAGVNLAPSPVASSLPTGDTPLPEDPEIYRDPLYEIPLPPEEPVVQKKQGAGDGGGKTNLYILLGGVAFSLLLLGVGIWAYRLLTSGADLSTGKLETEEVVVDCNAAAGDVEKKSCIAESYAKCSLASWTGSINSTVAGNVEVEYQIRGIVEDACEVEAILKSNPEDTTKEGQVMVCSLDSTLSSDKALETLDGTTCSGNLADYLFPSDEATINEADTDEDTSVDASAEVDTSNTDENQ